MIWVICVLLNNVGRPIGHFPYFRTMLPVDQRFPHYAPCWPKMALAPSIIHTQLTTPSLSSFCKCILSSQMLKMVEKSKFSHYLRRKRTLAVTNWGLDLHVLDSKILYLFIHLLDLHVLDSKILYLHVLDYRIFYVFIHLSEGGIVRGQSRLEYSTCQNDICESNH